MDVARSPRLAAQIQNRTRPDSKNPETDVLFGDALKQGGITIGQSGGGGLPSGAKEEEILTLRVGPKPRTYSPPMTFKLEPANENSN